MTNVTAEAIDVWLMNLDDVAARRGGRLGTLLFEGERDRAENLLDGDTRRRFVAGREMLRVILGIRCGLAPIDVVFEYGPNGKPSMSSKISRSSFFNVAHCGKFCVVAVTDLGPVGVDIERFREGINVSRMASRVFPPEEARRLRALPEVEGARAFLESWVREEALVKAAGTGLLSLWASHRGMGIRHRAGPITSHTDQAEAASWTLCAFSPAPELTACIAVRGRHPAEVQFRSLAELEVARSA